MILAERLSYKLDQRLNKLSTNQNQQIPVEDKVLALNEAQIKLVKQKIDTDNNFRLGLDANKKRYQDLQFLVENFEDHPLDLEETDSYLHRYIAEVSDITPKYMFYIDSYMIADKGICKDRKVYTNSDLVKHSDIITLLNNSNYKPSFEYQETLVDISSDEIHVYTDGTFTPSKLYISYIRYPEEIDLEGYVKFDGSDSITVNCELEDYLEDELLDLAVENLAQYTENQSAAVFAKQRQATNE